MVQLFLALYLKQNRKIMITRCRFPRLLVVKNIEIVSMELAQCQIKSRRCWQSKKQFKQLFAVQFLLGTPTTSHFRCECQNLDSTVNELNFPREAPTKPFQKAILQFSNQEQDKKTFQCSQATETQRKRTSALFHVNFCKST